MADVVRGGLHLLPNSVCVVGNHSPHNSLRGSAGGIIAWKCFCWMVCMLSFNFHVFHNPPSQANAAHGEALLSNNRIRLPDCNILRSRLDMEGKYASV